MSMPAGWYDDGSGRQRWWDGARWAEQFAPDAGSVLPPVSAPIARVAPVFGFVGLALAVLGTILACIPATFIVGVVVLIAGFVVSLIGVFKKNAVKWPSIVGLVLSVVGGAIGTVVTLVIVAASLAGPIESATPTAVPPTTPSASPTTISDRPSPEEIATQFEILAKEGGIGGYEEDPDFYPCMGRFVYDSEVSDESLRLIAQGEDPLEAERETAGDLIAQATLSCQS